MAYESVNSAWPEGTRDGRDLKPTPAEAVAAVRRLWRFAMKKPCPFEIKTTSGNRRGGIRRGILSVNPDRWGGGWHEVVHMISHHCAFRLYPKARAHDALGRHAFVEREMIQHVVASGWLDGKLRRPENPEATTDLKAKRHGRIQKRITEWERKRKRAEAALQKLRRQDAYYSRPSSTSINSTTRITPTIPDGP